MILEIFTIKDELAETFGNLMCVNPKVKNRTFKWITAETEKSDCDDKRIPSAHTATMQSMYDYGNNTAQFLQNAMSAINTAKQSNEWYSAEQMQQATSQIMSSSAQQISNLNQQSSQQSSSTTRGNEKGISGEGHGDIEWNPGHTARKR